MLSLAARDWRSSAAVDNGRSVLALVCLVEWEVLIFFVSCERVLGPVETGRFGSVEMLVEV